MAVLLRAFLIAVSVLFFGYVCLMIRRDKLLLKYSIMWLVLSLLGVIVAIFPESVYCLSSIVGFESPSNLVFVAVIVILLVVCLTYSRALSRQAVSIKDLIQEVSMLKSQVRDSREEERQRTEDSLRK